MRAGFDCEVAVAFLESGRTLSNASNAAAVIAGIGIGMGSGSLLLCVSLAAWIVESWFAVRVAIDRWLFRTLAANPENAADWLDCLLVDWKLIKDAQSPDGTKRSMADRSRGALRLWRMQGAALTVQLVALIAALVLRVVNR